jgi:hypothetical protein
MDPQKKSTCPVSNIYEWTPKRHGESRSPCPALNAMANHGYLPHDGRDLSLVTIICATRKAYHLTWPLAIFLVVGGYVLLHRWWKIDLEDLDLHNAVEHNASLAHEDADLTQNPSYAPSTVNVSMLDQLLNDSADGMVMTAVDIARARVRREATYGPGAIDSVHQEIARGEMALALGIFGKGTAIPLEFLRVWFQEERLPDGWVKNEKRLGLCETIRLSSDIRHAMENFRTQGNVI